MSTTQRRHGSARSAVACMLAVTTAVSLATPVGAQSPAAVTLDTSPALLDLLPDAARPSTSKSTTCSPG